MIIPIPEEKKKKKNKDQMIKSNKNKKPEILENVPDNFNNGKLKVLLENQGE